MTIRVKGLLTQYAGQMTGALLFCGAISTFFFGASLGESALTLLLNQEGKTALGTFLRNGLIP